MFFLQLWSQGGGNMGETQKLFWRWKARLMSIGICSATRNQEREGLKICPRTDSREHSSWGDWTLSPTEAFQPQQNIGMHFHWCKPLGSELFTTGAEERSQHHLGQALCSTLRRASDAVLTNALESNKRGQIKLHDVPMVSSQGQSLGPISNCSVFFSPLWESLSKTQESE